MLVLSKLTNINHANGGSYDPPLFLYSALFAARGRFGGASPHGGGLWLGFPARRWLWRGFPARRRALAGLSYPAAALAGLPRTAAGFGVASPHGGALAGLPRTAAGFGGLPRTAALWRGSPHRGGFGGASPHGGGLWWVALPAAGFGVASPHGGGFGGASPPGFLCRRGTFGLVRAVFSLFFAYAPGIRQKHPQKFRRLHLRISYCIGKFKKFVKINE